MIIYGWAPYANLALVIEWCERISCFMRWQVIMERDSRSLESLGGTHFISRSTWFIVNIFFLSSHFRCRICIYLYEFSKNRWLTGWEHIHARLCNVLLKMISTSRCCDTQFKKCAPLCKILHSELAYYPVTSIDNKNIDIQSQFAYWALKFKPIQINSIRRITTSQLHWKL